MKLHELTATFPFLFDFEFRRRTHWYVALVFHVYEREKAGHGTFQCTSGVVVAISLKQQ